MKARIAVLLAFIAVAPMCSAQDVQVSRTNRTISVTADESISAEPDLARLSFAYLNYAATNQEAYATNLRGATGILSALKHAGIPEKNIQTESLQLERVDSEEKWTPEQKQQRQFHARQSWHVLVAASDAQRILDIAIRAGANDVGQVEWAVADPVALQAKASGAALSKARSIAEQMAQGLGARLGELVYANNRAPVLKAWRALIAAQTESSSVAAAVLGPTNAPSLKLFPEQVKQEATVHAVFAIQ
jgi:uncharacterized protein YggE